jgi:hypothetical protein
MRTEKMYRVYTIVERPKQDDYWLNIGAAFPHEDGKGFNVVLQAHPIGEKIVLRLYEPRRVNPTESMLTQRERDDALARVVPREPLLFERLLFLPRSLRPGNHACNAHRARWFEVLQKHRRPSAGLSQYSALGAFGTSDIPS